jgi:hypothetical protein
MIKMMFVCVALFSLVDSNAEDLTELKVTEGKITPAKPPEPQDRSEGSKAAAAAAAAGAASGKVNCYMLMDKARKAEDESQKTFLMMAASQQCSQAAALEQNAKENDKGRKQLSQKDIPTAAKYEAGTSTLQASTVKDVTLSANEETARRSLLGSDSEWTQPPTSTDAPNTSGDGAQKNALQSTSGITAQSLPAPGALSPMERSKLTVNDQAPSPTQGGSLGGVAGSAETRPQKGDTLATNLPQKGDERARRNSQEPGYLSASGGDSGGAPGEDPIDALMAQLMGEPSPQEQRDSDRIQTWENDPAQVSGAGENVNIFEYAALRYQKLQSEQKRLGGGTLVSVPARSIASATSLHEAAKRP